MIKFATLCKRYLVTGKCFVVVNVIILILALSYTLDVVRVNVMTVSFINKGLAPSEAKADKSFTGGWELAMALIKPHLVHCLDNASKLTDYLRKSIMHFLRRRVAIHPQVDPQPSNPRSFAPCV